MSAEARRKIAAAQRRRWAKVRAEREAGWEKESRYAGGGIIGLRCRIANPNPPRDKLLMFSDLYSVATSGVNNVSLQAPDGLIILYLRATR